MYVCFLQKLDCLSHIYIYIFKWTYLCDLCAKKYLFVSPSKKFHSVQTNSFCKKKLFCIIPVKKIYFAKKKIIKKNHSGKNSFWKKSSLCEKSFILEKSHSLKNKFYFQFSFATNEQVWIKVKKYKLFFSNSPFLIWSSN